MPGPHAALPALALTAFVALAGVVLALVGHFGRPRDDGPSPSPGTPLSVRLNEPIDIGAMGTALLDSLATAFGLATTTQMLCTVHHQQVHLYEDRLEKGAADAVHAVSGAYTRALKVMAA